MKTIKLRKVKLSVDAINIINDDDILTINGTVLDNDVVAKIVPLYCTDTSRGVLYVGWLATAKFIFNDKTVFTLDDNGVVCTYNYHNVLGIADTADTILVCKCLKGNLEYVVHTNGLNVNIL